jgi:hypothetical protein
LLTEQEIFDCLGENLLKASDRARLIARYPASGRNFMELRTSLKLAEGACRQAGHWRGDARWVKVAVFLEQAHQLARGWLHRPSVSTKKLFVYLADALLRMARDLDELETKATGQHGTILTPYEASNPLTRIAHMVAPGTMPSGLLSRGRAA